MFFLFEFEEDFKQCMHSTWRTLKPMALIVTKNNYLYYYLGDFLLPKKRSILFLKDMN